MALVLPRPNATQVNSFECSAPPRCIFEGVSSRLSAPLVHFCLIGLDMHLRLTLSRSLPVTNICRCSEWRLFFIISIRNDFVFTSLSPKTTSRSTDASKYKRELRFGLLYRSIGHPFVLSAVYLTRLTTNRSQFAFQSWLALHSSFLSSSPSLSPLFPRLPSKSRNEQSNSEETLHTPFKDWFVRRRWLLHAM